jgi:hypothetical protein
MFSPICLKSQGLKHSSTQRMCLKVTWATEAPNVFCMLDSKLLRAYSTSSTRCTVPLRFLLDGRLVEPAAGCAKVPPRDKGGRRAASNPLPL